VRFLGATASSVKRVLVMAGPNSVGSSVSTRYRFMPRDRDSGFSAYDGLESSFLRANFVPLGEKIPLERVHKRGVPTRTRYFMHRMQLSSRSSTLDSGPPTVIL